MLNTFTSLQPPAIPVSLPYRRKRGAQPSNRNALNHGIFAVKNRTPLTGISASVVACRPSLRSAPGIIPGVIMNLRLEMDQAFQHLMKAENPRAAAACLNLITRSVDLVSRLGKSMYLQEKPLHDMLHVSQHALDLIHYDFQQHAITRDADSFRGKLDKGDFKSTLFQESLCGYLSEPEYPFISPRQWTVLEPLLPPSKHTSRRGRPPTDPRELLDAIFWKLARHARWQDLPAYYPPMLSCRRYYRRLFLSGRLVTLYNALYKDFLSRGGMDLTAFVKQGDIKIVGNRLDLRCDLDESWQVRTALLFLQQGYQSLRRFRREKEQDRKRKFPSLRMALKQRALQESYIKQDAEISYTPIDLDHLGPVNRLDHSGLMPSPRHFSTRRFNPPSITQARWSPERKESFVPLKI